MSQKPREIAIRLLAREITGPHIEDLMERELDLNRIIGPDRRLVQEIVYGIIRWHRTLDWLIGKKTDGKEQKSFISSLLKMGLYQMFWLDRIPDHAAVNESVQLARELGFGPQSGFINAVLRDFARDKEATKKMLADLKIAETCFSLQASSLTVICPRSATPSIFPEGRFLGHAGKNSIQPGWESTNILMINAGSPPERSVLKMALGLCVVTRFGFQ